MYYSNQLNPHIAIINLDFIVMLDRNFLLYHTWEILWPDPLSYLSNFAGCFLPHHPIIEIVFRRLHVTAAKFVSTGLLVLSNIFEVGSDALYEQCFQIICLLGSVV